MFACVSCKKLTQSEICPNCGNPTSDNWSGLIIVTKPEQSDLARESGITVSGEYCLRVR